MLPTFQSWTVRKMIECSTQVLLSSHWNIYHSTTAYFFEPPCISGFVRANLYICMARYSPEAKGGERQCWSSDGSWHSTYEECRCYSQNWICRRYTAWSVLCPVLLVYSVIISFNLYTCKSKSDTGFRGNHHTGMGNHMPYGITQRYLPPGSGDFPAFTSAEAGTRI